MTKVIYPGTFDPITLGHLDIVARAAGMFDEVLVAVSESKEKHPMFSLTERALMAQAACARFPNVKVCGFSGLLAACCRHNDATVLVRSVRGAADYEYEVPMAVMNRKLAGVETVFFPAAPELQHISGTLVREIARLGGDVSGCVTPEVDEALQEKVTEERRRRPWPTR